MSLKEAVFGFTVGLIFSLTAFAIFTNGQPNDILPAFLESFVVIGITFALSIAIYLIAVIFDRAIKGYFSELHLAVEHKGEKSES